MRLCVLSQRNVGSGEGAVLDKCEDCTSLIYQPVGKRAGISQSGTLKITVSLGPNYFSMAMIITMTKAANRRKGLLAYSSSGTDVCGGGGGLGGGEHANKQQSLHSRSLPQTMPITGDQRFKSLWGTFSFKPPNVPNCPSSYFCLFCRSTSISAREEMFTSASFLNSLSSHIL